MKHFIQQPHKGQPLLLVALLVAFTGAAKAQNVPPPNAGTVVDTIQALFPFDNRTTNTDITMYVATSVTAGSVAAQVDTTNKFILDGTTYSVGLFHFDLPNNTSIPRDKEGSNLTIRPPLPGYWIAQSIASISAPNTTTVTDGKQGGFQVYFGGR